MSSASLQKIEN